MFTKQKLITAITLLGVIFIMQSCSKNTTVYIDNSAEITTDVFFAKDIVPVFSSKCSMSGCHNTGGHIPDLSADKAYNALSNGNYLDKGTPANSSLYLWLTGKKSTAMPVGGPANPSNINQLVLAWIKQGAKNN
jgi:hypothetical protein